MVLLWRYALWISLSDFFFLRYYLNIQTLFLQAVHFMILFFFKVDFDTKNKVNRAQNVYPPNHLIEGSIKGSYQTESKGVFPCWKSSAMPNWWHSGSIEHSSTLFMLHLTSSTTPSCLRFQTPAEGLTAWLWSKSDSFPTPLPVSSGMLGTFPTLSLSLPIQCEKSCCIGLLQGLVT